MLLPLLSDGNKEEGYKLSDKAKFLRLPDTYTLFFSVHLVKLYWEVQVNNWYLNIGRVVYVLC